MADLATTSAAPISAPTTAANPGTDGKSTPISGQDVHGSNPQAARMLKLTVDGQEMEMAESEVIAMAQKGRSADKRFQEAAQARREAEQVVNFLKSNPKEAFKKLGIDVRKFSEDTLLEMIQHDQMTHEQKKAQENENELRRYRDTEKQAQERAHAEALAKQEQEYMQSYDATFVKALTESGLPKTPYTVKRMAELTLIATRKGLDLEPSQLAKLVREDYESEMKAMYGQADGDALLELLGKDAVKKLSKAQLSKYKATRSNTGQFKPKDDSRPAPGTNPTAAWRAFQRKTRGQL